MSLTEDFATLFQGRTDAYGTDEGGCIRLEDPVTMHDLYSDHLNGFEAIGVYPIRTHPDWPAGEARVKWGCVDFDIKSDNHPTYDFETEEEAHDAAVSLCNALRVLGITGWIERTRSHGRHVWVFASEWVPASHMRRALLVACGLADVPVREVNPKQEQLAEGQLGNYVRLPYPGALADGEAYVCSNIERYVYGTHGTGTLPFSVGEFVWRALEARSEPKVFAEVAELWTPPERKVVVPSRAYDSTDDVVELAHLLGGLGYVLWRDGPLNEDRSAGLWKLARICQEDGLLAEDAFVILLDADARWGKFSDRPDAEAQILKTIERAYSL